MEIALAVPFDANEIKKIITDELRKRLDQLSPLQGGKEYASFGAHFEVKIQLKRAGEQEAKQTLAWGNAVGTNTTIIPDHELILEDTSINDSFEAQEPNVEREEREMPMTVEAGDGRGGKRTKKIVVRR